MPAETIGSKSHNGNEVMGNKTESSRQRPRTTKDKFLLLDKNQYLIKANTAAWLCTNQIKPMVNFHQSDLMTEGEQQIWWLVERRISH